MATTPPTEPPPRPRHAKKRWLIPLALLVLVAALLLFAYARGTWADSTARNPTASADGIVTQLVQTPDGHKQVRAAVVLDFPPATVWEAVTDYANHDKIFRYVSRSEVSREADGRYHLRGVAHSSLWRDWPYDTHVTHEEAADQGRYAARWDEPSAPVTVNRGSWSLERAGGAPDRTLLVYTLEIEVDPYPTFLIRNLILDRIAKLVANVQDAVTKRQSGS